MNSNTSFQATAAKESAGPERDWLGAFLVVLGALWIILLSSGLHLVTWVANQLALIMGQDWPLWVWPLLSLVHGLVLLLPLAPLAWFWPHQPARAVLQAWAVAALFALVLAPARFVPVTAVWLANLLQITLTLLFLPLLIAFIGRQRWRAAAAAASWSGPLLKWALVVAPLLALPWLTWGAFGSLLDTILNIAAGLLLGLVAALLLTQVALPPLWHAVRSRTWAHLLGGLVAGVTLLLLATAFAFPGMQILLMFSLPALGWAVAALVWQQQDPVSQWPVATVLLGLAAAAALTRIDPAELQLILGIGEIWQWAFLAALAAMALGWLVSLLLLLARAWNPVRLPPPRHRSLLLAAVAISWLGGSLVYWQTGQPGFYGDRLFVILGDQADLSAATAIDDVEARRQYVYETLTEHAGASQERIRHTLDRRRVPYTPYYLMNALEVEGGPLLRLWLLRQPEVERVLDSPVLRPLPAPPPIRRGSSSAPVRPAWNLTLIGADRVWQEFGVTGEGITIGQSDSGVQWTHPEFAGRYRGYAGSHDFNWFDPWHSTEEPVDGSGHGTHTLGSALGERTGVAPGATWFACANLARNLANPALYLDCMQFMLAPFPLGGDPFRQGDPRLAADVLNNSWGCPDIEGCDATALQPAVAALRSAGIFVVASAGNDGPRCETIRHPIALYGEAFSVGAVDQSGNLADFSSRGPVVVDSSGRTKPDLVAPGVNVLSALPGSSYGHSDGTSMAGPHVAGVVALVWSANPALRGDIDRTEALLLQTARPYTGPLPGCVISATAGAVAGPEVSAVAPNNGVGYGIIDAYAAVRLALAE
jgi:subtilisin family serine protease